MAGLRALQSCFQQRNWTVLSSIYRTRFANLLVELRHFCRAYYCYCKFLWIETNFSHITNDGYELTWKGLEKSSYERLITIWSCASFRVWLLHDTVASPFYDLFRICYSVWNISGSRIMRVSDNHLWLMRQLGPATGPRLRFICYRTYLWEDQEIKKNLQARKELHEFGDSCGA